MALNQVLKRPIITEKALSLSALGKYTFEVDKKATKPEIKRAVKKAFDVDVQTVQVIKVRGKTRRFGRRRKRISLSDWKKAIIQLAPGQKIDIYSVPRGAEEKRPSSAPPRRRRGATEGKKEGKKK
jgi:large subunit ribosomal protein L23